MHARTIPAHLVKEAVRDAVAELYCHPDPHTLDLLRQAHDRETEELPRDLLDSILANAEIAARDRVPACQDTGLLIVFAELGSNVVIAEATLRECVESAAADAWREFWLRDSLAPDALRGQLGQDLSLPQDSLTVILHLEQVPGDGLTLRFALKGGGAENCSALRMFAPTTVREEIAAFIVETVVSAGGKPCPPVIVGVGIGGDFELCALLAKKSLLHPEAVAAADPALRLWAEELLAEINARGKGVQGMGGKTTALEVRILTAPCHIASLPVAVNIECHSHRYSLRKI